MTNIKNQPLADLLRPGRLDDVLGQAHLLGQNKPLRLAFDSGVPHSMIFWGPPGVGKTTLARLSAQVFDCEWIALSAVLSGVKDIREAIDVAKYNQSLQRHTIVFIDEIHRFNKAQQDALLPYTESGLISFIGATTENPSFSVNGALLSRVQVYALQSLTDEDLRTLLMRALREALSHLTFDAHAADALISLADGDARRLLNLLEQLNIAASVLQVTEVTGELVRNTLLLNAQRFDKQGDYFYDQISALHKSVRGSNPDAALYWLCRMLSCGVDRHYLIRRIIRMSWEDVGLADPRAMTLANEAANSYDRLGSPEGELAIAEAVIYLAVAAKSNAAYKAFNEAMAFVKQDKSREVPLHLRNAPTALMKKMGHGKAYRYAHDEPYGFAAKEQYLPDGMKNPNWYQPVDRGLELKIRDKMAFLRTLDDSTKN